MDHVDNRPYKSRILAQPFGSRRAPSNWGRVVSFLQFLARMLLSLAVGACVDDVFFFESSLLVRSGFRAFKRLCALLGFATSGRKGQKHSTKTHLLGAEVTLMGQAIRTSTTAERAQKLRGEIVTILNTSVLTPDAASNLAEDWVSTPRY